MRYGMQENENYKVFIKQAGGGEVEAYVPETFQLSVNSAFGQPFGQGLNNSTIGTLSKIWGVALTSQSMTAQIWEGTQPIEITLELELVAESSPKNEVLEPIKKLLAMTMPSRGAAGSLLEPPGPKYKDIMIWKAFGGKGPGGINKQITIRIGTFLLFDNVVIESVNTTFYSMMHESGIPLRAVVAVTFKTFFIQLSDDLPNIFLK